MRKWLLVAAMLISVMASSVQAEWVVLKGVNHAVWKNAGYAITGDANVIDDTGLVGTELKYATVNARYGSASGTVSTISNARWISREISDAGMLKIRFRGSAVNTAATLELWGLTGADDAEFICDIALVADASAAAATAGGYYFSNVTDSNTTSTGSSAVIKQNCATSHRMGVLWVYTGTFSQVVVVPKTIANGTLYWDFCGGE